MNSSSTNMTRYPLALLRENAIVRNTNFKDVLVALYGAVAFFLCTLIAYRFGKAQEHPLETFLLVAIPGSCATFLVSLLLNLPRPDKFRILGLTSMFIFYVSMTAFFIWYSHDDCYSSLAWNGLLATLLFTVINIDRTFDPHRVKDIEKALFYVIIAALGLFVIWALVIACLWLTDLLNEFLGNAAFTSYSALGLFWLYWEILSLRIRERITRETVFFLRRYNQKSVADALTKTSTAKLKRGHPLSIQVVQAIGNAIIEYPSAKSEGVKLLEDWRQNFGKTLESVPDRVLLNQILSKYSEISSRPQLRAILNDEQAYDYERMIAFRELTELSLDENRTVDPFEYLPPSGDVSTADVYEMLMGLIKKGLKSQEPKKYMGALHWFDALLYQYLHDGIKHIVVAPAPLETQLEKGDFQNSESDLKELVELSRQKFTDIDELLYAPLFALNLKRLEGYVNQTEFPIEDRVRLTVAYARKLAKKCQFLQKLIRQQQTRNIHQIINAVIQQKQNARIEIIREFAHSHPTTAPEADATFDIICEEILIHQALVNLVDNAITAMADSETKQLTFHTQLTSEAVVVKVIDTGCGIPAEIQPILFTEGGLKIARSNIEIHAGSLELEISEVGAGSAFSITLPRKLPSMR